MQIVARPSFISDEAWRLQADAYFLYEEFTRLAETRLAQYILSYISIAYITLN